MTLAKESERAPVEFSHLDQATASLDSTNRKLLERCAFTKHSKSDVVVETSILVLGLISYVHSKQAFENIFR